MNKAIKLTSSLCNAAFTVPKFIQPVAKLFLYTRMAALISYLRLGGGGGTPLYKVYRYVPSQQKSETLGLKTSSCFTRYLHYYGNVI